MANNCFYTMKVVSKDAETINRLFSIMKYEDTEYGIYRCFSVDRTGVKQEDDFFVDEFTGDMAWSCDHWFNTEEEFDNKNEAGGHYITLDLLCKRLGIGVELYSEEEGCEFQEHFLCDVNGNLQINESTEWTHEYYDENGDELEEPIEEGGFGDEYCDFGEASIIYGEKEEDGEDEEE